MKPRWVTINSGGLYKADVFISGNNGELAFQAGVVYTDVRSIDDLRKFGFDYFDTIEEIKEKLRDAKENEESL